MAHQLTSNTTKLEELKAKVQALPAEKKIQESKTVAPSTSSQTVTPDSGYDGLAGVTVNAMPTGSVGNPSIDVNSSGLITATTAVDAGYVDGTDKTGTKQLTTQAAKTITPTKSSQTAVASGRYTTGVVTVAAIPDAYQDVTGVDAVAVDVVEGKKVVNSSGETVTGTNPYVKATTDTEVNSQATKLAELKTILEGKAAGGGSGGSVETCTVTFTSSSMPGYGGEKVFYSALDIDGMITSNVETFVEEGMEIKVELNNVVCGSALSINYPAECTNIVGTASLIYADEYFIVFKAPNVANENCIVIL